jgi:hypothetical protein
MPITLTLTIEEIENSTPSSSEDVEEPQES